MKQKLTRFHAALVVFLMLVIIGIPGLVAEAASSTPTPTAETELACDTGRSIQVSGTAVVNVTPDRVLIQLGVQSNGSTPENVEAANSRTINQVISASKKLGIAEKDIVTDWYLINPIYENYSSLVISGYRINNVVAITLRDISKVNEMITAALNAGANQVVNVEFYLSDLRTYRDQARELAVEAASEKAQDIAAAAGSEAGCVMTINENTWSYFNGGWYGQNRDLWTQNTVQNVAPTGGEAGALTEAGPVNLGQVSVRAEVSASFSLK
ncbi:MAG: DUF541 domain-containing protein [Chloroflexi bacterium]|nr:MAG: DUF541 domain-containing protein [Chloroflexota bacterium]MBL1196212.1 DUF541 domain-containing protein [Chloroflexota bacterium]NOH13506.1 SIMPL domain-containing protein [Chloroflexota bacterium]